MNKKLVDSLKKLGLDDNQIEKLQTLGASSVEDLQELTESDLTEMGLPVLKARRVIREFSGQAHTQQPASAAPSPEEEVKIVDTTKAPPGTTAVVKLLRRSGDLARQLGLPEAKYWGCSHCRNDVGAYAEDEGLRVDQFKQCPFCSAVFVTEQKVHCYSCDQQLTAGGQCVNCGANVNDDFALKAMTVLVRKEQGTNGRVARATATTLLQDQGYKAQVVARAKAEKTVEKAEEGHQAQMPPFATGGGNITPIDWPKQLKHEQVLDLIQALNVFSIEELIEISRISGVDHENLPYRQISAFRRELVLYHGRRQSFPRLLQALHNERPEVGWAQVIGIEPQKAGTGDQIFGNKYVIGGDNRGATFNIGTNITGDRRDK